jgi:hypothetical protein
MRILPLSLACTASIAQLALALRTEFVNDTSSEVGNQIGAKDNAVEFFIGLVDPRLNYALNVVYHHEDVEWYSVESKFYVPYTNSTQQCAPRPDNDAHRLPCRRRSLGLERHGRDDLLRYVADQRSSSSCPAAPEIERL